MQIALPSNWLADILYSAMLPERNIDHAESLVTVIVEDDVALACSTFGEAMAWLAKDKA